MVAKEASVEGLDCETAGTEGYYCFEEKECFRLVVSGRRGVKLYLCRQVNSFQSA